ncbi:MAG: TrmH family RNA methyltransferase [Anaerotardibacter sp.]
MFSLINLESLEDACLDPYLRLTEIQLRNKLEPEKGIFIAESVNVIITALNAGYEPVSLLIPDHKRDCLEEIAASVDESFVSHTLIPVYCAPSEEIKKITGYELTRGILCAMRRKPLLSVEEVLEGASRVAVIEDVTNTTNVGAIFRSAAALDFDAVLVTSACCDPLYRRAIRVSMGTVFQIPWTRIGSLVDSWPEKGIDVLHEHGFKVASLALSDAAISLDDPKLASQEKIALVFGTEGTGLSLKTLECSDYVVTIPMAKGVDSLNVAAASAVAFWELRKR